MVKWSSLFVLVVVLAACGGGGGGGSSTTPALTGGSIALTPATPGLLVATPPTPFTPPNSLPVTSTRRRASATPPPIDYGSWWGLAIPAVNGVFAIQSFDQNDVVAAGNTLYAPTLKVANACLELTTYYLGDDSGVFVWDWCSAPYGSTGKIGAQQGSGDFIVTPVAVALLGNYLRNLGNGYAEYAGELYRDGNGYWHAIMYDFATNAWDDIYNTAQDPQQIDNSYAVPSDSNLGWDMFEQHYTTGTYCPAFGTIGSRGLATMSSSLRWSAASLPAFELVDIEVPGASPTISPCLPWTAGPNATITPGFTAPGQFWYTGSSWLATSSG